MPVKQPNQADRVQAGVSFIPSQRGKKALDKRDNRAPDLARLLGLDENMFELFQLATLDRQIEETIKKSDPLSYGLPDLLKPQQPNEDSRQFYFRQNSELKSFVEGRLWIVKGGKFRRIKVNRQMLVAIADLFYDRVRKAIWWKPRGGGGSLGAALMIFLRMVYHRTSFLDIAGCLMPGTPVWTKQRGWIPVEGIKEGEEVYTAAGEVSRVTAVTSKPWSSGVTTVVPHGFGKGHTYTSDHKLSVIQGAAPDYSDGKMKHQLDLSRLDEMEPQWVPAGEVKRGDVFVIPRPQRKASEQPPLLRVKFEQKGRGPSSIVEWTPELCRFIGYWLAEGSLYESNGGKYVRIDGGDTDEWIPEYQHLVRSLFQRQPTYDEPGPHEVRVVFGNKLLSEFLEQNFGRGAAGKTIPWTLIEGLSDECLMAMLVGYLRGDGNARQTSRGNWEISCYTVSPALAGALYWLSIQLGMFPSMSTAMPDADRCGFKRVRVGWILKWGAADADRLAHLAFHKHVKPHANRQRRVWVTESRVYVGVRDVRHAEYQGDVWDLTVDGDPSFAVPGMIAHNSSDQSKNIYEYVKQFWECFPGMAQALFDGDPLTSEMKLVNGVYLRCIANSEKQGRGKHPPAIVCDEACQRDSSSDVGFEAALNTVLSEPDPIVLLLSTFHHPTGMFADYWDNAEAKGFTRYKWDCFEIMSPCTRPDESKGHAPDGVPFDCKGCPLTWMEEKRDLDGNTKEVWMGCNGKARYSDGFQTFEATLSAKEQNEGTQVFAVEFAGMRPDYRSRVMDDEWVEAAKVEEINWERGCSLVVGIDWGLIGQTAVVLGVVTPEFVGVVHAEFMTGKLTSEVIELLREWWNEYGPLEVYADGSHPYNNLEVMQSGIPVTPVHFKKWKRLAYGNLITYMVHRRLKIVADLATLIGQLRGLKRDKKGDIEKKNDHGPDALVCLLLRVLFVEQFARDLPAQDGEGGAEDEPDAQLIG